MRDESAVIHLALALSGWCGSHDSAVSSRAAKAYAQRHPDVRYEWWTEKTAPGQARVAWRLIKEKNA